MKARKDGWEIEGTLEEIKDLMEERRVIPRVEQKNAVRHYKKTRKHWGWAQEEDNIVKTCEDKPVSIIRVELKKAGFNRTIQAIKSRKSVLKSIVASNNISNLSSKKRKVKKGWTAKKWQFNEDAILKRMFKSGATIPAIKKELKIFGSERTKNSIRCRINRFFGKKKRNSYFGRK